MQYSNKPSTIRNPKSRNQEPSKEVPRSKKEREGTASHKQRNPKPHLPKPTSINPSQWRHQTNEKPWWRSHPISCMRCNPSRSLDDGATNNQISFNLPTQINHTCQLTDFFGIWSNKGLRALHHLALSVPCICSGGLERLGGSRTSPAHS